MVTVTFQEVNCSVVAWSFLTNASIAVRGIMRRRPIVRLFRNVEQFFIRLRERYRRSDQARKCDGADFFQVAE